MIVPTDTLTWPLPAWQTFYEIVGTAGATLIGIQFVVIALIANVRMKADEGSINAFGTPTVVHFGYALTLAAIMTAPWPSLFGPAVALALCGMSGFAYAIIVLNRARRQTGYKPVLEDWIWYTILPCALYAVLPVAAMFLHSMTRTAPFLVAGVALALLLVGIHNAWDSVTHVVATSAQHSEKNTAD